MPTGETDRLARVAHRLAQLTARLEKERDSRCVFTYAYLIMSRKIATDLEGRREIDPMWVVSLAEAFARRYFRAIEEYDRGQLKPGAWMAVFDALVKERTSVLEDLLFAITAHIVHDLPLALEEVSPASGPEPHHIHDFHSVNDMMQGAIEDIQRLVSRRYSWSVAWLDRVAEDYDEILTNFGARMSRGLAWYNAVRLANPRERKEALSAIERNPSLVVANVLHPPIWSLRLVARLVRLIVRLGRRWPDDDPRTAAADALQQVYVDAHG
jgi:Family of unknown function (DUF5995)